MNVSRYLRRYLSMCVFNPNNTSLPRRNLDDYAQTARCGFGSST